MNPLIVGIIGLLLLVLGLFSGMPIAFVMALVGFGGFAYLVSVKAALGMVAIETFSTLSGYAITVIPMFMLMGAFAFHSGASSRLYNTAHTIFGRFKGGLGISTIVAAGAFGAMCGSGAAATATFSKVALPEMRKHGYDPGLAGACCAAGGPLSVLIPPSSGAIIYCVLVGKSISHMFIAGILPGIMKVILFGLAIYVICRLKPKFGPAGGPSTFMEKVKSVGGVSEMVALFIIVMGEYHSPGDDDKKHNR
ncbi:C4-dicarboxylate TRAP transporter large permease protein DctM [subsurface metagenome]